MLLFLLLGLSSLSFAQSPTPLNTAAPKGVPSSEDPLKEIKPSKKQMKGTHLKTAKSKSKQKLKKKIHK